MKISDLDTRILSDYIVRKKRFQKYILRVMSFRWDDTLGMLEVHVKFGIGASLKHARVVTEYLTKDEVEKL